MPRDRGGIGRTGNKHKKAAKFDAHRCAKAAEDTVSVEKSQEQENVPNAGAKVKSGM